MKKRSLKFKMITGGILLAFGPLGPKHPFAGLFGVGEPTDPVEDPGPVAKIASGGELSRISLAIQVVAAGATDVPVMVFDEVDAGIGGWC